MKLIDLFFCLIYRIGMELYLNDEKESKVLATGFMISWGATVLYDCYLYIVYLFGLEEFFRDIPMRAIEFPLWGILGILLWIRYYKCKKTITQDFDMAYKEWHPNKREFAG